MSVPFIRPGGLVDERVRNLAAACSVPPETVVAAAMDALKALDETEMVIMIEDAMKRWEAEGPPPKQCTAREAVHRCALPTGHEGPHLAREDPLYEKRRRR